MSGKPPTLPREKVRAYYDRLGTKLDFWARYAEPAIETLLEPGGFTEAGAVFELGCGTGRVAERLLDRHLPETAAYTGVDLSPTMVELAQKRLERFGARVAVSVGDGTTRLDAAPGAFDRFLCLYVLDLLAEADIRQVVDEAHRVLSSGGRICVACLTPGDTKLTQLVTRTWGAVNALAPSILGGCRPLDLREFVTEPQWVIRHASTVSKLGVPSQVLVAERGLG